METTPYAKHIGVASMWLLNYPMARKEDTAIRQHMEAYIKQTWAM